MKLVAPKLINDGKYLGKCSREITSKYLLLKIFAEILAMITIISLIFYMLVNNQQEFIVASLGFYIYAFYRAFPSMQSLFSAFISIKGWSQVLDNVYEKINDDQKKLEFGDDKIDFIEKIAIEKLFYKYQKQDEPIISDLNLEIKKGTIVGLKENLVREKLLF